MSYTDLAGVKLFLGITSSSKDALLTSYITQTTSLLNVILGDLTQGTKTFLVNRCDFYGNHLRLMTRNITALLSINNVAYTGVLNTDYNILPPYKSTLFIKDIHAYWADDYFPINVTAGFAPGSDDYVNLANLQNIMIAGMYAGKGGNGKVKSYKLGDRSFTFRTGSDTFNGQPDGDYTTAQEIFDLYAMLPYT